MLAPLACSVLMFVSAADDAADAQNEFLARVEAVPLVNSFDKPVSRIVRNDDGEVIQLNLRDMALTADDFATIGGFESLEGIVFYGCPVTDADVRQLGELSHLRSLNLTSTEITDASLDTIVTLPSLRYLCLGNVNVTPAAIQRLKDQFEAADRDLGIGYNQRR